MKVSFMRISKSLELLAKEDESSVMMYQLIFKSKR